MNLIGELTKSLLKERLSYKMGCAEGRTVSSEEKSLAFAEEGLKFNLLQASYVDTIMRKHSTSGQINESELQKIAEILRIEITNTAGHQKISSLFSRIKHQEDYYSTRTLLSLGILLSRGRKEQKAELLYEVFDEDNVGYISIENLTEGLTLLTTLSLEYLGCLIYNGQNEYTNEFKISKYIETLSEVKEIAVSRFTAKLPKRNFRVSMVHFIEEIKKSNYDLVTPVGWREYLVEISNTRPPKQAYTEEGLTQNLPEVAEQTG